MINPNAPAAYTWIRTGDEAFARMAAAIESANRSVRFETYIFADSPPAHALRDALTAAAQRGLEVRVLIDAFGSLTLVDSFWDPLRAAGGQLRWFNPLSLHRFNIRNHRKLLVCDHRLAVLGGFNVAKEWVGDGLNRGWRDLGLELRGPLTTQLAWSFDELFLQAEFPHRRPARLRRSSMKRTVTTPQGQLLLTAPGRGPKPIRSALLRDLRDAARVRIIAAYFLPSQRLRFALAKAARRGASVQLLLPGISDVPLLQAASRSLYRRFLRAGVRIYEYQPQILHSKFIQIDQAVYVGSANLDPRSLGINYDFLVRLHEPAALAETDAVFEDHLQHSRPIELATWPRTRSLWSKLKERFAFFLFTRVDPLVTRHQLRNFR